MHGEVWQTPLAPPRRARPWHSRPMYTFVFVVSTTADEALRRCHRALERVRSALPTLGSPGRIAAVAVPELGAAYATLLPEIDRSISLLQVAESERLLVLSYGERPGSVALAACVCQEFERGGGAAVAALEGNFSALIVERDARRVWLCGTLLGHRALYYGQAGAAFVVSPHDLALVATGLLPLEVDRQSLASMLVCDWSLTGRPLLARAQRCHPLELVCFQSGSIQTRPLGAELFERRLAARDRQGVACQVELVADQLSQRARAVTARLERIEGSLTAGLDSRALWATLVASAQGKPLLASTSGGDRSLDVRVARRLARCFGAEHVRRDVEAPAAEDFTRVLELMAFFANGDTSAKRALTRLPSVGPGLPLLAGGTGGEIFRGFFYPYLGVSARRLSSEELADKLLRWRFRRYEQLAFQEPSLRTAVRTRLEEALRALSLHSQLPHDILDLFYLFERYGRWGARPACFPWSSAWTPFESIGAIRAALQLPAPVGSHCTVHSLLIRRHLPARAYWTPLNGAQLVPLQGPGRVRHLLRQGLGVSGLFQQKLERRLQRRSLTPDDLRARFLAQDLRAVVRSLLADPGSLSRELFGGDGVDALLVEHEQKRNQLPLVGILLTAEQWWRLARRLAADSSAS
jgi:hypothetical protein